MEKVLQVSRLHALYWDELRRGVDLAARDGWLEGEIARQLELVDAPMRDDPVRPFTVREYEGAAEFMRRFAAARLAFLACELDRGVGTCR